MSEQASKTIALKKALQLLVQKTGLTPEEVAGLRLSHVHLAGKNPHISFIPFGGKEAKRLDLDLDLHRALVGWLVARPDSTGDFLFPGEGTEMMDLAEISHLAEWTGGTVPPVSRPVSPAGPEPVGRNPEAPPSYSRPVPLPSTPEMGTPPRGMGAPAAPFFRSPIPSAPPEADEPANTPGRGTAPFQPPPPPPGTA